MTDVDPLSADYLCKAGERLRASSAPSRGDLGYHGHPLRRIARELLRLEDVDEQTVAWILYDLADGRDIPNRPETLITDKGEHHEP